MDNSNKNILKYHNALIQTINKGNYVQVLQPIFEERLKNKVQAYLQIKKELYEKRETNIQIGKKRLNELEINQFIRFFWDGKSYKNDAIKKESTRNAIETLNKFVKKNTDKISLIFEKRPECITTNQSFSLGNETERLQGIIDVKCNNDSFQIQNQIVYVPEVEKDDWQRTDYFRFPTTFHNILHNGVKKKSASEKWMNEEFIKRN